MSNFSILLKLAGSTAVLATALFFTPKAQAAVISLNFEGVDNGSDNAFINNFYNGGTSSVGTSGTNYGITFSPNAQAINLNTLTSSPTNTSRGGQGDPNSQGQGLAFRSGTQTFINYASGFDTGFSFFYSTYFYPGKIEVYDGLEGTGNLLTTLDLPKTNDGKVSGCTGYNANYCPFAPIGVSFLGTAKSIGFGGTANYVVFDDVTFGSAAPGNPGGGGTAVPEPFTIVGTMIGGAAALRMRKRLKVTNKL